MEQHIEKLTQQFHERRKRARQLSHEMEAAGLADNVKDNMLRLLKNKESKYLRLQRQKMNRSMFRVRLFKLFLTLDKLSKVIRHIGIGAFGKVTLVRKKDTDQVYAMKTLIKADVIQKQQAAHVKAERDILAEANSPWIVKLYFSFQDAQNLYFIMEYVPGGDMMQLLINMGIFPESLARDIKPDNILIDKGGHIKLTDFGLCTGLRWTHDKRHYVVYDTHEDGATHLREDSFSLPPGFDQRCKVLEMRHHHKRNRAHSVVGTGNYMAPEVIQRTGNIQNFIIIFKSYNLGHTQLCDWWSVGVILYEMVFGRPPFMSRVDDPAETQYMIVHWYRFLDLKNPMGARLSRQCIECIARLCCDQGIRLGHRQGAKDIKEHVWFKGIDFLNLRNITPEHVPRVRHPEDTSNFDTFEVCRTDEEDDDEDNEINGINEDKNIKQITAMSPSNVLRENRENGKKHSSNIQQQQQLPPNFIDFTFRHFFSDGIGGSTSGIPHSAIRPGGHHGPVRPSLAPLMESAERQAAEAKKANEAKNEQINGNLNSNKNPKNKMIQSPTIPSSSNNNQTTILQIGEFPRKEAKEDKELLIGHRKPFQALRLDDNNDNWSTSNEEEEENEWTAAASRC
uniref:non-specific serine/threonine protein kinase n=1 Tax=Meloidogyne hapla TaxID=6305 RepID=A0A1I8BT12_MELHA